MKRRRAVVVDDSAIARHLLHDWLEADGDLEVVGEAADGDQAIDVITRLRPNVATIDLRMPGMSGLDLVSYLMAKAPLPILVLTGEPTRDEAGRAFEAMRRGALDLLIKPSALDDEAIRALRARVRWLATVPVVRHIDSNRLPELPAAAPKPFATPPGIAPSATGSFPVFKPPAPVPVPPLGPSVVRGVTEPIVVGIAASAGGPTALANVLGSLPADLPACLAVVQHLPRGFAPSFVSFLQSRCPLTVKLGEHGMVPTASTVVLAPDDHHLEWSDGKFVLVPGPPVEGHRPAGTVLLKSLAQLGPQAIGVVLSGIGRDGADGLRAMRDRHALTIAQDSITSVVYGMPRAAVEEGAAQQVLPIHEIGRAITAAVVSPWRRRVP
ncbi:MAG TPA: chemotaxis protein CheB [Kofleriaceae bacterium]|nr:chemotaxis protein CheB [Kofleriaceae bacterium]